MPVRLMKDERESFIVWKKPTPSIWLEHANSLMVHKSELHQARHVS